MPESAEEIHARVVAAVGEDGRLPMPSMGEWDVFPWEVVDGAIAPKRLARPAPEKPRQGEGGEGCHACAGFSGVIWENERWVVTHPRERGGLPLLLFLQPKEHLDLTDLDDAMAAEYGRLQVWLHRIMGNLPNIARVHVDKWGDGAEHLHLWFIARPAGLGEQVIGSYAVEWYDILPAGPEDVWREDLRTVAAKLANHDGHARV
ncbi:hypothetical protein [Nocardioides sp. LS1]|uniref:hypothetical protein n=1 Tax=Nocardioides sp. LS1 TaxID=1027620 RepID=UPI000F627E4B|nr:hypothetical protein [Nocardioides sp. LS1]GCD90544.1 hypothetical protein NLS1_25500 [Nocardioides sp. LS1]